MKIKNFLATALDIEIPQDDRIIIHVNTNNERGSYSFNYIVEQMEKYVDNGQNLITSYFNVIIDISKKTNIDNKDTFIELLTLAAHHENTIRF